MDSIPLCGSVQNLGLGLKSRRRGRIGTGPYSSESLLIDCVITVPTFPCVCVPPDKIKSIPNLTPLIISIDPDRDTVEAMAAYVKGRLK